MRERRKEVARHFLDDDQRRVEEQFRTSQLPYYGLPPSFQGPRMAGLYRTTAGGLAAKDVDTVTIQFELIHGDPLKMPLKLLSVVTSVHSPLQRQPTPLRHILWERVVTERAAMRPARKVFRPSVPKRGSIGRSERILGVSIDRTKHDFTVIEEGIVQAAELNLEEYRIILRAHRWPIEGIELVTIKDIRPYLEGRRRSMLQRRAALGL